MFILGFSADKIITIDPKKCPKDRNGTALHCTALFHPTRQNINPENIKSLKSKVKSSQKPE